MRCPYQSMDQYRKLNIITLGVIGNVRNNQIIFIWECSLFIKKNYNSPAFDVQFLAYGQCAHLI